MDAISAARRPKYARLDGYQDVTGASPSQLSNLADAVLLHILSLLTTKEAVRTCLLSKRWIHLWTSLPELRFDDMQLVERAFLLRDPQCTLKTFALEHVSVTDDASCSVITKSINAAVRCKVQELSLRLSSHCESSFVLPGCVFGCQTLVKLELGFTRLKIPPSVQLPSLKVLRIWRVNFAEDAAAAEKLFSRPILEELQLVDCFLGCENITALEISAPKLRVLSISEEVGSSGYQVSINGTNLESFDYFGEFLNKFTIVGASEKLVRVKFSGYFRRNHMNPVAEHVHSLLASVSTTTNLILTYQCFEAITYNVNSSFRTYSLPTFGNLTHLAVDMLSIHLHRGLFVMLKKFPHLQTLELDQRHKDQAKLRQAEWEQYRSEDAPSCFSTHLKKIVVKEFCGARKEVNAVRVLLENAIVLEEMIIAFQEEFFTTFNTKRLTSLHRGSPKCRLSLVFGSVAEV